MNYTLALQSTAAPGIGEYRALLSGLDYFSKKLVLFLLILGNECEGADLSSNGLDKRSMGAIVAALRSFERPNFAKEVTSLNLCDNALDADAAEALAPNWIPGESCRGGSQEGRKSFAETDDDDEGGSSGAEDGDAIGDSGANFD